ncbi:MULTISPECIES: DHH family phosphoesterase [Bacillaceae]|uniref:Bifunctional oligoribonuclease/PAP phosphatase NrnA n=1 Tax=Evansella alkalicola TaxID=745819 RepID=A0ABS6JRE1_9BACI|nr:MULTISPECIES: bifunctional oligoribonuclease/PAP phosphatase NrnA [Bacillaceae]MBU9721133.1 bifunctional oligoribonuclease/PAP phosphatase NrnA [Bacillus alkalicola]
MKLEIIKKIREHDTIIIHRHVRPDPDAIGSQAGLKELIKTNYPNKTVYLAGEQEESLAFLQEMDTIDDSVFHQALIIVCDTANTERIDDDRYKNGAFLIKIDHHPNVDEYGDMAWVDTNASSTCEMICDLFSEEGDVIQFSDEASRLLYAGIVGDTGRFKFSNTTKKTFYHASRLINANFDPTDLYDAMYETSLPLLRLKGYVLSEVEIRESGAGVVYLTKDILEKFNVDSKEAAGIVNAFSTLKGIKSWVFFVEEPDVIRVRLRSKGPEIHKLAEKYNGGGHPMASGASVTTWDETKEFLVELDQLCANYNN